ncbi:carboxypeptidase regulatory-like domain-containing protein [Candidatus Bathyarchaeota archaeon]|nr:carboxypeptidase regulatory-like domain-containing protein [Candidatus Bathyarchaeota archaeon]
MRKLVSTLIGILLLSVLSSLISSPNLVEAESKVNPVRIYVETPLKIKYVSEPVVFSANFSYGEAALGSLRLFDERDVEIPYQILEAQYYPNTQYYSYAKILILTDVSSSMNRSYTLKCSPKTTTPPDYTQASDLILREIKFKNGTKDIVVENSYLKAVFRVNPTLGLYALYDLSSGLNESLTPYSWSFASPCVMVNNTWLGIKDMENLALSIKVNGSLMVEISMSGSYPGVLVERIFRFYANSRFFDFETVFTLIGGSDITALSPFNTMYRKGIFQTLILSNGSSVDLSSVKGFSSFNPGNWSALAGFDKGIFVTLLPTDLLGRLIIGTEVPGNDMVIYLVDPFKISSSVGLAFKTRVIIFKGSPDVKTLDGEYTKYATPLIVKVLLPKVLFNVEGPTQVDIYDEFTITLKVAIQTELQHIILNASYGSGLECFSKAVYRSSLPARSIWTTRWLFRAKAEGTYNIEFTLSTWNETFVVNYPVGVVLPILTPPVNVTFRVTDFDGETILGDVVLNIFDSVNRSIKKLYVDMYGNVTTALQMSRYRILLYKAERLIGCNYVDVFHPENITLKTWLYDFNVIALGEDGEPAIGALAVLKPLNGLDGSKYRASSNSSGIARFNDVFNGSYVLEVFWRDELVENTTVSIQSDEYSYKTVFNAWPMKIMVSAPKDTRYVSEPVVFSANFSYGEAALGSLRLFDERDVEIPYQILEAQYYPNTQYYSYAKILILTDVSSSMNRSYTLKCSPKTTTPPDYTQASDLILREIKFKNGTKDIVVENSYLKAVFRVNPTLGLYALYDLSSGLNESLTPYSWSFASPCVMVNNTWLGIKDMENLALSIKVNGSLMVEISMSGSYPGVLVERIFRFYANSRFFDFETVFTLIGGSDITALSPFNTMYRKGIFQTLILSNGSSVDLSSVKGFSSFNPGNWSALAGFDKGIFVTLLPTDLLGRLIIGTEVPGNDMVIYLVDPFKISSSVGLAFKTRVIIFKGSPDVKTLDGEYTKYATPLIVKVLLPKVLFNVEGPTQVDIYDEFTITLKVAIQTELQHIILNASYGSGLECFSKAVYRSSLPARSIWTTRWLFRAKAEGTYNIEFTLSTWNETFVATYPVKVLLPVIAPSVNITFFASDYDGETVIRDVMLKLVSPAGITLNLPIGSSGNVSTKIQMGRYEWYAYDGNQTIGKGIVEIFHPENITLRTWLYDFNIMVLSSDGSPLAGVLAILKSLGMNATKEYVRLSGSSGLIRFNDIINGSYNLKILGWQGELIENTTVIIQKDELYHKVIAEAWVVKVRTLDVDRAPVLNASVYLLDENMTEIKTIETDEDGYAFLGGLVKGNYSVRVEYLGVIVGYQYFEVPVEGQVVEVPCRVCKLEVIPVDPWDNPLIGSEVTISFRPTPYTYQTFSGVFKSPEKPISLLLPEGSSCTIRASSGLYDGSSDMILRRSTRLALKTSIRFSAVFTPGLTIFFWIFVIYSWRRRIRVFSVEVLKLKSMLSKLEELYRSGEVEAPLYGKLKREYEDRLHKLLEGGS